MAPTDPPGDDAVDAEGAPPDAPAGAPTAALGPADHPGEAVVLFDGVCNLCSGFVQFLVPRDPAARLRFAPLQSDSADALLAGCDVDPAALDSIVLVEDGTVYTKSTAVLRIAHHLGGVYRPLWALRFVPRVLRDVVYDLVAGSRYRVFGKKDRCMLPTPDLEARFLETSASAEVGGSGPGGDGGSPDGETRGSEPAGDGEDADEAKPTEAERPDDGDRRREPGERTSTGP